MTRVRWQVRLVGAVALMAVTGGCGYAVMTPVPTSTPVASAGQGSVATVASPTAAPSAAEPTPSPFAGPCQSDVDMGVLPTWAREGFSEPEPAMPHVLTRSGDVVAILFGFPLASPPREGLNNKILWVQRAGPTSPVEISAQRMEGTEPVGEPVGRNLEGGFAPSYVDLPEAGCWRLTLSYGDQVDSIDLEYIQTPAG